MFILLANGGIRSVNIVDKEIQVEPNFKQDAEKNFGNRTISQSQQEVRNTNTQNDHQKEVKNRLLNLGEKIIKTTNTNERDRLVKDYKWLRYYFDGLIDPIETAKRLGKKDPADIEKSLDSASAIYAAVASEKNIRSEDVLSGITGNETKDELDKKLGINLFKLGGENLVNAWHKELDRMIETLALVLGIVKPKGAKSKRQTVNTGQAMQEDEALKRIREMFKEIVKKAMMKPATSAMQTQIEKGANAFFV